MRYYFKGIARDGAGKIIPSATVSVFLADTSTVASVYTTLAGTTAVNSATSGTDGVFEFYIDAFDYDYGQTFDLTISKAGYTSKTYENIKPTDVVLGTYTISADKTISVYTDIPEGVTLSIATGVTLTFTKQPKIGRYKVFSLTGTAAVAGLLDNNAVWFTGEPDGATDNLDAIKGAVAATATGGKLTFPECASTVNWVYDNATAGFTDATTIDRAMTIRIDGRIKQTGYLYQENPCYIFYVTADDVTFEGNGTIEGVGTYSDNNTNNLYMAGLIYVTGKNFTARGITFKNSPQKAIFINATYRPTITGCKFTGGPLIAGATTAGHFYIYFLASYHLQITDNQFYATATAGAVRNPICGTGYLATITDNNFTDCHEHAIYVTVDHSTISHNVVSYTQDADDQKGSAIKVLGSNNTIDGNTINYPSNGGITLSNGSYNVVSNNAIMEFGQTGIIVTDQSENTSGLNYNSIIGNTIIGNQSFAVVYEGIRYLGDTTYSTADSYGGKIANNIIVNAGGASAAGLKVAHDASHAAGYDFFDFDIDNNKIISTNNAIAMIFENIQDSNIRGNTVRNTTGATAKGIHFADYCLYNVIENNRFLDDQASPTLSLGVYMATTTSTNNTIRNNKLKSTASGDNVWGLNSTYSNYGDGNVIEGAYRPIMTMHQPTPTAKTTAATLTIAELLTGVITGTHAAGATQAYTLPTGTLCDAGCPPSTDEGFDWYLINLSLNAVDTITVTAGVAHTIVGNPIVQSSNASTGGVYGNGSHWRTRKTAANTFVTTRLV